jgi:hypothetical protein
MTNQEKKEQLQKLRTIDIRIDNLIDRKKKWMGRACNITSSLSGMPRGGGDADRMGSIIANIEKIEDKLEAETRAYIRQKSKMTKAIKAMSDSQLQALLTMRYIDGCTWERIAVELHYDIDGKNVYKLHGKALSMLQL